MSTHTGTIHWFSRLKGIGRIRPDAGGYDVSAEIEDFVVEQKTESLEEKLVSYEVEECAYGARAVNIHIVQRL
ncbi:cold-shock protein [Pseudoduganella sp. UC29_106]|uniref:cold-shock protein n=1 Tax=Pseudoduganella sp. UC29_106 TaxID=3374553 RepID=UPI0037563A92